jgi:hypothetical protein
VIKVLQEIKEQLGYKVLQEFKESPVLLAHKVLLVIKVLQEIRGKLVTKVLQVIRVQ